MKTIKKEVSTQLVEKKSKFISFIYSVSSVEEAENKIKEIRKKYYDARHHCFAYRIYDENNYASEHLYLKDNVAGIEGFNCKEYKNPDDTSEVLYHYYTANNN